jgi:hypothetical protein
MLFELGGPELEVVADVLRRAMSDLREEIYKTETSDFQTQLKMREAVLRGVLERIAAAEASGLVAGEPASKY